MSSLARVVALAVVASTTSPVLAAGGHEHRHGEQRAAPSPAKQDRCEHGVQKALCTRCNPKLAAVYKAKGDWCPEHERPESQCALCHPELARRGVK